MRKGASLQLAGLAGAVVGLARGLAGLHRHIPGLLAWRRADPE